MRRRHAPEAAGEAVQLAAAFTQREVAGAQLFGGQIHSGFSVLTCSFCRRACSRIAAFCASHQAAQREHQFAHEARSFSPPQRSQVSAL